MIGEMISLPGAKPTKVEENVQKTLSIIAYIGLVSAGGKTSSTRYVFVGNLVFEHPFDLGHPLQLRNS